MENLNMTLILQKGDQESKILCIPSSHDCNCCGISCLALLPWVCLRLSKQAQGVHLRAVKLAEVMSPVHGPANIQPKLLGMLLTHHIVRFRSTTKVLAKPMLEYYRNSVSISS